MHVYTIQSILGPPLDSRRCPASSSSRKFPASPSRTTSCSNREGSASPFPIRSPTLPRVALLLASSSPSLGSCAVSWAEDPLPDRWVPPLVALEFEWDTGSTSGVQNRGFGCCTASWFRTIACFISFLPRFNTLRWNLGENVGPLEVPDGLAPLILHLSLDLSLISGENCLIPFLFIRITIYSW